MSVTTAQHEESEGWPALEWEDQTWLPSGGWGPRAAALSGPTLYQSAVPPSIARRAVDLSAGVGAAASDAAMELSRLDAELGSRITAFGPVLLRSEAASSSQIENLTASARALFTAELGGRTGSNAKLVAANVHALLAALDDASRIDPSSILAMHAQLMAEQTRHRPGEWRDEPVWIGTRSDSPRGADFVAPHSDRVPGLVDDLVEFSRRLDVPVLALIAISHAQFETIHPFTDGNGRTGRAFVQALLRAHGVTRSVAVPVSAGLLADVHGYHQALTAYREGDLEPIVEAFASASFRAVVNVRALVEEIDAIRAQWESALTVRRSSRAWTLLDVFARRPILSAAAAAAEVGVQAPNVYPPLRALEEAGIVTSKSVHGMGPVWMSDAILTAIDRFAERAGRRSSSAP